MLEILSSIIPLDIASIISPGIFALAIFLLSNKVHPREKLISFFSGSLLAGIIVTLIGFSLGQNILMDKRKAGTSAITDLIIGAICIFFTLKSLKARDKKIKLHNNPQGKKLLRWFIIGFLASITNLDAVFLNMTAAKEVGVAEQISLMLKSFLLCFNLFFFTLPITLPVILYLLFPTAAKKSLSKINFYLIKYGRYIVAIIFFIMGIVFLRRGIIFLY